MGSHIYTKGGDGGQTSLLDGTRVGKDDARVRACGTVDEACSYVGAARSRVEDACLAMALEFLQHRLYNCSSCLAAPAGTSCRVPVPTDRDVVFLEKAIDRLEADTGPIDRFILPGGCHQAGLLHVARTVVRRAEREVVALSRLEPVDPGLLRFLNRASDLLFAAARHANLSARMADLAWNANLPPPVL